MTKTHAKQKTTTHGSLKNVRVVSLPVVQDSLTYLRDVSTPLQLFRWHCDRISQQLIAEASKDLKTSLVQIQTPVTSAESLKIDEQRITILPILRSGVCMLPAALQLLPMATIGFVGLEKVKGTSNVTQYFFKMPPVTPNTVICIIDPMLATGSSVLQVLRLLKKEQQQPKAVIVVNIIATPKGSKAIYAEFPQVSIVTASVDEGMSPSGYIEPGLGDFGDRYCGTA